MKTRVLYVLIILFLNHGCGGGDKHLPSSNPPEYDPNRVYSIPAEPSRERRTVSQAPRAQTVPELPPPAPPKPVAEPMLSSSPSRPTLPADLAKRILKGGPEGRRALVEAVTASGFAVLDSPRRTVVGIPSKPEMGIPLEDWEVTILARAAADQLTVPFGELEADVALAVKDERAGHLITTMLLDEIRSGVNDSTPTVRTWASLIVELGRQSAAPYDLLSMKDFTEVHLNGLQQVLMLKHLSAEFFSLGIQRATDRALSHLSVPTRNGSERLYLVAETGGIARRVSSLNTGAPPCGGFGTDEGNRTSKSASGWGWGLKFAFGPLRNLAEEIGLMEAYRELSRTTDLRSIYHKRELISSDKVTNAELNKFVNTLSKLHNLATTLLSLAELTAVMNAVTIDITMDPPPPLERTKTRQPGQYAKLTAALSFDIGKLDLPKQLDLHCAGLFFMGLGLDFSMPENGPIKGADVEWTLVKGGLKMDAKAGHKVTEAIVELENPGRRIQDAGVGFGDVKKSVRTNENGVAKVGIHGAPQKRELGRDPQPIMKEAIVRASVQLKPADILRDLTAALKGPWALPAEVLYRSHLLGKNYRFEVRDWTPSYVLKFDSTITATMPSGQGHSLADSKSTVHATVSLTFIEGRGWVGEGMMDFETVPMNPPAKCLTRVYGKGMTTFHVTRGSISKDDEPFAVTLYIKPGETQDISELNCGYMQDKSPMAFWNTNFYFSRMQTFNFNTGEYEIAGWTPVLDSDTVAKKTIRANCSLPARRCQEETTLILKLADEPAADASPAR